jgi:hypothetical protein
MAYNNDTQYIIYNIIKTEILNYNVIAKMQNKDYLYTYIIENLDMVNTKLSNGNNIHDSFLKKINFNNDNVKKIQTKLNKLLSSKYHNIKNKYSHKIFNISIYISIYIKLLSNLILLFATLYRNNNCDRDHNRHANIDNIIKNVTQQDKINEYMDVMNSGLKQENEKITKKFYLSLKYDKKLSNKLIDKYNNTNMKTIQENSKILFLLNDVIILLFDNININIKMNNETNHDLLPKLISIKQLHNYILDFNQHTNNIIKNLNNNVDYNINIISLFQEIHEKNNLIENIAKLTSKRNELLVDIN